MTKDEVIRRAREAGLIFNEEIEAPRAHSMQQDRVTHFAQLIAAHKLEQAAKICEARIIGDHNREDAEAKRCAEAIRARKDALKA